MGCVPDRGVGIQETENSGTPENSRQLYEQTNKRKKREHRGSTIAYVLEVEGEREILLINQLHDTIVGDNIPLYIARESLKKKKSIDLNSDQKQIQNYIRKLQTMPRTWVL